nr:MAG TPA: YABBY protein [Caudoviricetes sp.]
MTKPLPHVSLTSVLSVVGTLQKPLVPSRQQKLRSSESFNDNRQSKLTNDNSLWLVSNVHGRHSRTQQVEHLVQVLHLCATVAVVHRLLTSLSVFVPCSKLTQVVTVRCHLLPGVRLQHTLQTMVSASVVQVALPLRCGSTPTTITGKTINLVTIGICRRLLGWMIRSFQP